MNLMLSFKVYKVCILSMLTMIGILLLILSQPVAAVETSMPIVNDATCWSCHSTFSSVVSGPFSLTPVIGGKHTFFTSCQNCHTSKLPGSPRFQECTYCHYDKYPTGYPRFMSYRHTSDGYPSFQNIVNRRHSISTVHFTKTVGCEKCHSTVLTDEHYKLESRDKDGNRINCNTCHTASYLGKEVITNQGLRITKTEPYQIQFSNPWYPPAGTTIGRVYVDTVLDGNSYIEVYALFSTSSGSQWGLIYGRTSGTVKKWIDLPLPATGVKVKMHSPYASSIPDSYLDVPKVTLTPDSEQYRKIQTAITNKDTTCEACHDDADHEAIHNGVLDPACQSCHKEALTTEHIDNVSTVGKNYDCTTCHGSTAPKVQRAITAKNLDCEACHNQGHGIGLVERFPADIELYPAFMWSNPLEITPFVNDPTFPDGYDDGQLMISNRRQDVSLIDIWSFYNQKMLANGWLLDSGAPTAGSEYFSTEFSKDGRFVTIRCYHSEKGDGTGQVVEAGFRIEIWYR